VGVEEVALRENEATGTAVRPLAFAAALLALTKQKQTLLLLVTGIGAYALSAAGAVDWPRMLVGSTALWAAMSGCTVLNMVLDRDIDAKMERTRERPLPSGRISVRAAVVFGLALAVPGLVVSWLCGAWFGAIVAAGFAIDLGVYTAWLKRRTAWSIVFGGVSGGMPALAGRALAIGRPDVVGGLLALGVLLWIPAHILTLAMRRAAEYETAGVPVWPTVYGATATRRLIAASTTLAPLTLFAAGVLMGIAPVALAVLALLGAALAGTALHGLARPSERRDGVLFKAASVYMAGAFACHVLGTVI
jgi:protoheme IX farnesyltransferase